MTFFKKTWWVSYIILWFVLIIFFFNHGERGELFAYSFGRATDIFISGLSLLIAIQSFLVIRRKLREGKSRLVYIVTGAILIPIAVGTFAFSVYGLFYSYWYYANF